MPRTPAYPAVGVCVFAVSLLVMFLHAIIAASAWALPFSDCPQAVWELQNPLPQNNTLYGIWGSTANDIFAVGGSGTILHFDGNRWRRMDPGTHVSFSGVWGSAPNDVFAVGGDNSGGRIFHYDGTGWAEVTTAVSFLNDAWGTSANDVFAVGKSGCIVHYDGVSWAPMESNTTADLQNVWAGGPDDVFAVGWPNVIIHYDGTSWTQMDSGIEDYLWLDGIWGAAADDVYACGDEGTFLHYDGTSWSLSTPGPGYYQLALWGFSGTDIFMAGQAFVSHFDGVSWTTSIPTHEYMFDVWGSAPDDVYAVGAKGVILHYDGSNWSLVSSPHIEALSDVWGTSRSDVFAVGEMGVVLHYDGKSWETSRSGGTEIKGIWGSSSSDVYAVSSGGKVYHFDGSNWTLVACPLTQTHFRGIWGASPSDIFMVGEPASWTATLISRYDGASWDILLQGSYVLCDVWGSSATDVFVVGWGGLIYHYDGTSCTAMESGTAANLESVWGSSASNVYAVGGTSRDRKGVILHYDGATWSQVPVGTTKYLLGVSGNSATDVWAVGESGLVLHFDGAGWSPIDTELNVWSHLNGIWSYSECGVFAVGEAGAILHCGEPGAVPTFITFFDARADEGGVRLTWEIASDDGIEGFRIYRAVSERGKEVVLNERVLVRPDERGFFDAGVDPGVSYRYTLGVVGHDGNELRSHPVDVATDAMELSLSQNYPNPFNPTTNIRFTLPVKAHVALHVFDAEGRLVRRLVDATRGPGVERVQWDGTDDRGSPVSSGVYFCRLSAGDQIVSRKLVLVR